MPLPRISIVVAVAENGVIGRANGLPWRLPEDLKHFKAVTMGKPVLMGRRTYESIGRPLPGRRNIVLTRAADWSAPGVEVVHDLATALECAGAVPEAAVIGGAELFRQTLPLAQRIHLTRVHADIEGDTFMPPIDWSAWREVERTRREPDERNAHPMSFSTLERVGCGAAAP